MKQKKLLTVGGKDYRFARYITLAEKELFKKHKLANTYYFREAKGGRAMELWLSHNNSISFPRNKYKPVTPGKTPMHLTYFERD